MKTDVVRCDENPDGADRGGVEKTRKGMSDPI